MAFYLTNVVGEKQNNHLLSGYMRDYALEVKIISTVYIYLYIYPSQHADRIYV